MNWLWNKATEWLVAAGALIALLVGIWWQGRRHGVAAMEREQEQHRREMRERKRKIDSETDDLAPADLDIQFQRWLRKDER